MIGYAHQRNHLTPANCVIMAVAEYAGITVSELKSGRRHKKFCEPRFLAYYLCELHTSLSYPQIGRAFDGRHHTTVMHGVKRIRDKIAAGDELVIRDLERLSVAVVNKMNGPGTIHPRSDQGEEARAW